MALPWQCPASGPCARTAASTPRGGRGGGGRYPAASVGRGPQLGGHEMGGWGDPEGHPPAPPRTHQRWIFQPPAPGTRRSERRARVSVATLGLQSSCKRVLGCFFFKLNFYLGWPLLGKKWGAGVPRGHPCTLRGLAVSGGLGPFPGVQPRGSGRRGAPTVPGFPGSPRPAPPRGPRPAPLRPPPAGRAETRARGGGPRGGGGRGAAPTLAGSRAMAGEGGARGAGGRAGRPRPRWTEPPGSQLPPAERGRPFSAA